MATPVIYSLLRLVTMPSQAQSRQPLMIQEKFE